MSGRSAARMTLTCRLPRRKRTLLSPSLSPFVTPEGEDERGINYLWSERALINLESWENLLEGLVTEKKIFA